MSEIRNVPAELAARLSEVSFAHGASGISENLQFHQPDITFDPQVEKSASLSWNVYFTTQPAMSFVHEVQGLHPQISVRVTAQKNQDWLAEWKKNWQSFELTPPFWVVPSWLKSPVPKKHTIRIDPGMAFGTGTHTTTQMASSLLQDCMQDENIDSVLDVGTGTGILAILAERLGADQVDCTDTDAEARRVARENFASNDSERALVFEHQIDQVKESYDLVVANIIDGVLIRISEFLKQRMKSGGHLIVTGILLERENLFFEQFGVAQFHIRERLQSDEWVGYWLQDASA